MNTIGELPASLVERIEAKKIDDAASLTAAQTPLPGPLRDAFSDAEWKVDLLGKTYCIRKFKDRDFQCLQDVGHPLAIAKLEDLQFLDHIKNLRGPNAWILCKLLTMNPPDARALFKKGYDEVLSQAEAEFGETDLQEISGIFGQCIKRYVAYFGPMVSVGESEGEEGQPAQKKS